MSTKSASPHRWDGRDWYYYNEIERPPENTAKAVDTQPDVLKIKRDNWKDPKNAVVVRYQGKAIEKTGTVLVTNAAIGLNRVTEELNNETDAFIRAEDIERFIKFAIDQQLYISVRRTGSGSIEKIGVGLACKPHDILEKSIKPKSIDSEKNAMERAKEKFASASDEEKKEWEIGVYAARAFRNRILPKPDIATVDTVYRLTLGTEKKTGPRVATRYRPKEKSSSRVVLKENEPIDIINKIFGLLLNPVNPLSPVLVNGYQLKEKAKGSPSNDVINIRNEPDLINKFFDEIGKTYLDLVKEEGKTFKGYVGWWFVVEVTAHHDVFPVLNSKGTKLSEQRSLTFKIPVGILRVGNKESSAKPTYPNGVPVRFSDIPLGKEVYDGYTGDYDLHCVYNSEKQEPHAELNFENVEDSPHVTAHNRATSLWKLNQVLTRERIAIAANNPCLSGGKTRDRLANLIQHGSQNLYRPFVEEERMLHKVQYGELQQALFLEKALDAYDGLLRVHEKSQANLNVGEVPGKLSDSLLTEVKKLSYLEQQAGQSRTLNLYAQLTENMNTPFDPQSSTVLKNLSNLRNELRKMKTSVEVRTLEQTMVDILLAPDDGGVLAFTPFGEVFILSDAAEVSRYYSDHQLVQHLWTNNTRDAALSKTLIR